MKTTGSARSYDCTTLCYISLPNNLSKHIDTFRMDGLCRASGSTFLGRVAHIGCQNCNERNADVLSDAMCAYVETITNQYRLGEFIAKNGLDDSAEAIRSELNGVLANMSEYLWEHADSVA